MKQSKIYTKEEIREEIKKLENVENCLCDLSIALEFLNNNGNAKNYKQAIFEARTIARQKQHDFKKLLQEENGNNIVVINIESVNFMKGVE